MAKTVLPRDWNSMAFRDKICWISDNYATINIDADIDDDPVVINEDAPEEIKREWAVLRKAQKDAIEDEIILD